MSRPSVTKNASPAAAGSKHANAIASARFSTYAGQVHERPPPTYPPLPCSSARAYLSMNV
jgi:hypothetical protein